MTVTKRREREKQERRAAIVDAAEVVSQEKGFEQATMEDIAAKAELSKGTLYLYFKSKDDLFAALCVRVLEGTVEEFEELAAQAPCGMAAVRTMMLRHTELMLQRPQHFRTMISRLASGVLFDETTPEASRHRELIARMVDALIAALERGKQDRSIRKDLDAVAVSSQLWSGLIGTLLFRVNSDEMTRRFHRPVNFNKIADGFIELICNGLAPNSMESLS